MSNAATTESKWGPILLVGGSGRLGYFIAKHLQAQPECGQIVSVSRSSTIAHSCDGVEYCVADVRDKTALSKVMLRIRPTTVINAAAPAHTNTLTPRTIFDEVFVKGQDNLIDLCREVGTKYMICTTSANVIEGDEHTRDIEDMPYWPENSSSGFSYWVERARGERRLLAADSGTLQTVSLRLPLIIGEREYAFVPSLLKTLNDKQTDFQIGNDTGLMDTVSGFDAARAHVLALRALMKPDNDVHGEAFNIIGPYPLSFWTMARIVWKEAGWKQLRPPYVMPGWLAWGLATVSDAIMYPFGVEAQLSKFACRFMMNNWTYDGSKAKIRLGYVAQYDTEAELKDSVRWYLKHSS